MSWRHEVQTAMRVGDHVRLRSRHGDAIGIVTRADVGVHMENVIGGHGSFGIVEAEFPATNGSVLTSTHWSNFELAEEGR